MNFTKEEFTKLYTENTTTELVRKLKVSRGTIVKVANSFGLTMKKGGQPKKKACLSIEELKRLYNTITTKELAKRANVSITTLTKILKENGVKMKQRGQGVRTPKIGITEG